MSWFDYALIASLAVLAFAALNALSAFITG